MASDIDVSSGPSEPAIISSGSDPSSESAPEEEPNTCLICGQLSHGFHFGVLACRACAAFFRRTVAELKSYACRQSENCPIHKSQRNMCRACRFRKCEVLGMNKAEVQLNRDPIGRRGGPKSSAARKRRRVSPEADSSTTVNTVDVTGTVIVDSCPAEASAQTVGITSVVAPASGFYTSAAALNFSAPSGEIFAGAQQVLTNTSILSTVGNIYARPLLQRMLDGYRNFQASQKSLCTVIYPDNIFAKDTYRLVQHEEFVKMERGCLSLLFSMLTEWFQPFDELPHFVKVASLRKFSRRFIHANGVYRTTVTFPDADDTRYVLHHGQYMDTNNAQHFICKSDIVRESDRCILVEHVLSLLRKWKRMKLRMQRIGMRDIELTALAGVMLWNDVATLKPLPTDADAICARIYAEIHADIAQVYGFEATGPRLGAIIGMIHDFNVMEREIHESKIIRRVFYSYNISVWDDDA